MFIKKSRTEEPQRSPFHEYLWCSMWSLGTSTSGRASSDGGELQTGSDGEKCRRMPGGEGQHWAMQKGHDAVTRQQDGCAGAALWRRLAPATGRARALVAAREEAGGQGQYAWRGATRPMRARPRALLGARREQRTRISFS
jgi:hypothetical protein